MKTKNKNLNFYLLIVFILANFLLPLNFSLAADGQGASDLDLIDRYDPEIQRLKDEIEEYQNNLSELEKQQNAYENSIRVKRQEINNLNNQLGILDDSISKIDLEIQSAKLNIEKTNLEIENIKLEIERKEREIRGQKDKMSDVIKSIDKHERKKSYLEILIVKGELGEFFKAANEFQVLEESLNEQLSSLNDLRNQLNDRKVNLESRKKQLVKLQEKLSEKNDLLSSDKLVKAQLLSRTQGQEANFQKLLDEVKAEQNQINADIQSLEIEARKKLLESQGKLPVGEDFIWPVPSRKVTAYFHDPDYPYRYIFEHPAVDIGSTPHGTPIRAAKSGYVAKVKFSPGSTSYGYILLVHEGGLSTVYGHISKPYVNEDSYVVQGEVIALSGGTPGTSGAGNLTTGAHLHFEVRLNGIPVDPLKYLP